MTNRFRHAVVAILFFAPTVTMAEKGPDKLGLRIHLLVAVSGNRLEVQSRSNASPPVNHFFLWQAVTDLEVDSNGALFSGSLGG